MLTATDAAGNVAHQAVLVTVGDVNEDTTPPHVAGTAGSGGDRARTVVEGETAVMALSADEDVTWSVSGGPDAGAFRIDPATGALAFAAPPAFGSATDADGDNVYLVTVTATDAAGNATDVTLRVTVTDTGAPAISGPSGGAGARASAATVDEGTTTVATFAADEAVTWSISGGPDGGALLIDPATGALAFAAPPDFEAPADSDGDNAYVVTVAATDAAGSVSLQAVAVTVANVTDTPSELFEERRDEVEGIVADVELNHLRAALASTQDMVRSARGRFIEAQRLRERCRALDESPIATAERDDDACSPLATRNDVPFDVDGTLEAGVSGVSGAGTFFGQDGNFEGTRRRIISGDFQVIDDGEGTETFELAGRVAWERLVSEDVVLGYFLGGSHADSTIDQGLGGTISKNSLALGGYVVAEPVDGLHADGFASLGLGRNDLALSDEELELDGTYDTRSVLVGGALSGVVERQGFEIRPELSAAYGFTDVGEVDLDAVAFDTTEEVTAAIDGVDYATVRLTPEALVPLHRLSDDASLVVAPSLACEWADGDRACGEGLRLGLRGTTRDGMTAFAVTLDADRIGDTVRTGITASIEHRF